MDRQFAKIRMARPKSTLPTDPVEFAISLGFKMDEWQKKVLLTEKRRTILNCSRQAGKSTVASFKAVNKALNREGAVVLLVSPTLRQSSELFRKTSEWFRRMSVKPEMPEDNKLSCTLENGSRIISLPGTEGNIRAYTADLIIEDEASRVDDDLFQAVRPMLAVSKGELVLMSTPFGKRGHFYDMWERGGEEWERIEVPATEVDRITPEFLASERRESGEWWFQQEYMCKFQDAIGSLFSFDVIQNAFTDEIKPLFSDVPEISTVKPLFAEVF
jgi:hypothetical protein